MTNKIATLVVQAQLQAATLSSTLDEIFAKSQDDIEVNDLTEECVDLLVDIRANLAQLLELGVIVELGDNNND